MAGYACATASRAVYRAARASASKPDFSTTLTF